MKQIRKILRNGKKGRILGLLQQIQRCSPSAMICLLPFTMYQGTYRCTMKSLIGTRYQMKYAWIAQEMAFNIKALYTSSS